LVAVVTVVAVVVAVVVVEGKPCQRKKAERIYRMVLEKKFLLDMATPFCCKLL